MNTSLLFLALLLGWARLPAPTAQQRPAHGQVAPAQSTPAPLAGTYRYLSYTILDREASPEPLPAEGVGGTLALLPDGRYEKHLTLTANGGTVPFNQLGRYTFTSSHISFSYTDRNGRLRTDEGSFRLTKDLLTITLAGFPAGNQSTYTLRRQ